jgi:Interferon-induced transmembrane protein
LETNPFSAPPSANLPGYTPPLGPTTPPPFGKPENYLIFAVLVTCCCCLPFGVPAIVYAAQVDSKWHIGDYHGAQFSSGEAKKWCWMAFGAGLIIQVLPLAIYAFMVLMVLAGVAAGA